MALSAMQATPQIGQKILSSRYASRQRDIDFTLPHAARTQSSHP